MVELTKEKAKELDLCQSYLKAEVCMFREKTHALIRDRESQLNRKGIPILRAAILICRFHLKEVKWHE